MFEIYTSFPVLILGSVAIHLANNKDIMNQSSTYGLFHVCFDKHKHFRQFLTFSFNTLVLHTRKVQVLIN